MPIGNTAYSVLPTFTPGSSAQVDKLIAERVVLQERESYDHALSGIYGEDVKRAAERRGLAGIVFAWYEDGKKVRVHDMIMDEHSVFPNFPAFQNWNRIRRTETATYISVLHRRADRKSTARYSIDVDNATYLILRDLGPWSKHPTITNDAANVVADLLPRLGGRRLLYIDSEGSVDELVVKDGKFSHFAPGQSDFMRPMGARP